jgi:hypothetical protein
MKKETSTIYGAVCVIATALLWCAPLLFAAQNEDTAPTETSASMPAAELSVSAKRLVKNAVFEVVMRRPDPNEDPLSYEKPIDYSVVPFQIRTDKYVSIGTAFAVSATELATAFHVINLGEQSLVYQNYFIRDSAGHVFEVDKITAGDNERDFLIFTVKNHAPFKEYFHFADSWQVEDPVFSIGNALGEGIVRRNGLILGTVPEAENGRWNLLKSSAEGNPGNSGGPLVTPAGRVVALVTSLRGNILYSTPASVIAAYQRKTLHYRIRPTYNHLLLANEYTEAFEYTVTLPAPYQAAGNAIVAAYALAYESAMSKLFAQAPAYLNGPNNAYLLSSSISSTNPYLDYVDPNDNNWKLSSLNYKSHNLPTDGKLYSASVGDFSFYKIARPKQQSLVQLDTNPQLVLDLILANQRMERTLWDRSRYRILSFGSPTRSGVYEDGTGRTWICAFWLAPSDDKVVIMYLLPTPGGPVAVMTIQDSEDLFAYSWDVRKVCDHIHSAYAGTLAEWTTFLGLTLLRPAILDEFTYAWNKNARTLAFGFPGVSFTGGKDVFDWTDTSSLFILPSFYRAGGDIVEGINKVIVNRTRHSDAYFILTLNTRPDPTLGSDYSDSWDTIAGGKFPFNGKAAISEKDNAGSIGALLPGASPQPDALWTLYLVSQNPTTDTLTSRFNALKSAFTITE